MIKYGLLHNHTQNSIKDSVVTVEALCRRAKELGAPAMAISDHGTLTGVPSFVKAAKENDIKPVIGIEFYVKEDSDTERLHLCVYAADMQGYKAMMKAVKLSNKRIHKSGTLLFPQVNQEILTACFGPESLGYGHVKATSACIGGVIAGLHFQNEANKKELENLNIKLQSVERAAAVYDKNKIREEALIKKIEIVKEIASRKYSKEEKELKKQEDSNEYQKLLSKLITEREETEKAKELYKKLRAEKVAVRKQVTQNKKALPEDGSILQEKQKRLSFLKSIVRTSSELAAFMETEAGRYRDLFGKDNFFMELQYHGMAEEKQYMYLLDTIAQKLDIPIVAANDAHMLSNTDADIMGRETIMSFRYMNMIPARDTDKELYLKTDEELYDALRKIVTPDRARLAIENVQRIMDTCNVVFDDKPQHYPVFDKKQDAFKLLKQKAIAGIAERFPNGFPNSEYEDRLNYELKVIQKLNVSDYHLIVQDLISFGKKLGNMPIERYSYLESHIWEMNYQNIVDYVNADQSFIGYTVGPGRGSSAGSLICYLMGITDLDPIKYNLLFERYLNPERISMPDIDTDYANGFRENVIAYTFKKYGEDAVCRIITYSQNAAKSAIKNTAKALGKTIGREEEYVALGEELADVVPQKPHETISNYLDAFKGMGKKMEAAEADIGYKCESIT